MTDVGWTQDGGFLDADGVFIHAYDDVVLLRDVPAKAKGNCWREIVSAGTAGTVLFFTADLSPKVELECYPSEGEFLFAEEECRHLRLALRAKMKGA